MTRTYIRNVKFAQFFCPIHNMPLFRIEIIGKVCLNTGYCDVCNKIYTAFVSDPINLSFKVESVEVEVKK